MKAMMITTSSFRMNNSCRSSMKWIALAVVNSVGLTLLLQPELHLSLQPSPHFSVTKNNGDPVTTAISSAGHQQVHNTDNRTMTSTLGDIITASESTISYLTVFEEEYPYLSTSIQMLYTWVLSLLVLMMFRWWSQEQQLQRLEEEQDQQHQHQQQSIQQSPNASFGSQVLHGDDNLYHPLEPLIAAAGHQRGSPTKRQASSKNVMIDISDRAVIYAGTGRNRGSGGAAVIRCARSDAQPPLQQQSHLDLCENYNNNLPLHTNNRRIRNRNSGLGLLSGNSASLSLDIEQGQQQQQQQQLSSRDLLLLQPQSTEVDATKLDHSKHSNRRSKKSKVICCIRRHKIALSIVAYSVILFLDVALKQQQLQHLSQDHHQQQGQQQQHNHQPGVTIPQILQHSLVPGCVLVILGIIKLLGLSRPREDGTRKSSSKPAAPIATTMESRLFNGIMNSGDGDACRGNGTAKYFAVLPILVGTMMSMYYYYIVPYSSSTTSSATTEHPNPDPTAWSIASASMFMTALKAVVSYQIITAILLSKNRVYQSPTHAVIDLSNHVSPIVFVQCLLASLYTGEIHNLLLAHTDAVGYGNTAARTAMRAVSSALASVASTNDMPSVVGLILQILSVGILSFTYDVCYLQLVRLTSPLSACIATENVKQMILIIISLMSTSASYSSSIQRSNQMNLICIACVMLTIAATLNYSFISMSEPCKLATAFTKTQQKQRQQYGKKKEQRKSMNSEHQDTEPTYDVDDSATSDDDEASGLIEIRNSGFCFCFEEGSQPPPQQDVELCPCDLGCTDEDNGDVCGFNWGPGDIDAQENKDEYDFDDYSTVSSKSHDFQYWAPDPADSYHGINSRRDQQLQQQQQQQSYFDYYNLNSNGMDVFWDFDKYNSYHLHDSNGALDDFVDCNKSKDMKDDTDASTGTDSSPCPVREVIFHKII